MRLLQVCLAVSAVLGTSVALTAPADAAKVKTTYTVKIGTRTTGAATLTSRAGQGGLGLFSLGGGVVTPNCSSATSTISTTLSTAASAKNILKLGPNSFGGCTTRDGTTLNVTTKGTWQVSAVAPTNSSGFTSLVVSKVKIAVAAPGGQCSYDLSGSTDAYYDNRGTLNFAYLGGTAQHALVVSHFTAPAGSNHCEESNGDKVVLNGAETVTATSPTGAFTITSNGS